MLARHSLPMFSTPTATIRHQTSRVSLTSPSNRLHSTSSSTHSHTSTKSPSLHFSRRPPTNFKPQLGLVSPSIQQTANAPVTSIDNKLAVYPVRSFQCFDSAYGQTGYGSFCEEIWRRGTAMLEEGAGGRGNANFIRRNSLVYSESAVLLRLHNS